MVEGPWWSSRTKREVRPNVRPKSAGVRRRPGAVTRAHGVEKSGLVLALWIIPRQSYCGRVGRGCGDVRRGRASKFRRSTRLSASSSATLARSEPPGNWVLPWSSPIERPVVLPLPARHHLELEKTRAKHRACCERRPPDAHERGVFFPVSVPEVPLPPLCDAPPCARSSSSPSALNEFANSRADSGGASGARQRRCLLLDKVGWMSRCWSTRKGVRWACCMRLDRRRGEGRSGKGSVGRLARGGEVGQHSWLYRPSPRRHQRRRA